LFNGRGVKVDIGLLVVRVVVGVVVSSSEEEDLDL